MDGQLKWGILNICILQLLRQQDRYGYDLIKQIQAFFPDTEESTLYTILRRMNTDGLTERYDSPVSHGPQRKYYRLTGQGRERLQEYLADWEQIEAVFSQIGL